MIVFLSYAVAPDDGPIAARLRALAAAYDLAILLPDRSKIIQDSLPIDTLTQINSSDAVIALVARMASYDESTAVRVELKAASIAGKPIVALIEQGATLPFDGPANIVYFDRRNPTAHEHSLMNVLHQIRNQQQWKQDLTALGWIAGIALGLVALSEILGRER